MLRKSLLALAAVAALGAGALSATDASALTIKKGIHVHWHGHWGHHHFHRPYWAYAKFGYRCYVVKKLTPWGVKVKKVCY